MGYVTGQIKSIPRNGKPGKVAGDDGTIYFLETWPASWESPDNPEGKKVWKGAKVRGISGPGNTIKGLRLSKTSTAKRHR